MPIVSSVVEADAHTQREGGRFVVEKHTDDAGQIYTVGPYLAPSGFDVQGRLNARAQEINVQLAESEALHNFKDVVALALRHQTAAQFAARFWRELQSAFDRGDKVEFSRLIWWLYQQIQAGRLTSDQARLSYNAFFGRPLTSVQWNTLVTTRFLPARDRYQAILNETQI